MSAQRQSIRFERVRGFGRIFADTRNFVRDNFVVFFKTIVFLVGPFALLTCTLQIFYQVNIFEPGELPQFNRLGSYIAGNTILLHLRWSVNGFITAIVVAHFVKVYREKGQGNFEVGDVSRSILRDFGGTLIAFIVMLFGVALVSAILGYIIYGLAQVSVGTAILLLFAGGLGYFLLRYPFWYYVYSVFIARTSTPKPMNVFKGMELAGKVFAGNWWLTWVLIFLMWLIVQLIGSAVAMPAQIIGMIAQMASYNIDEQSTDWKLIETVLMSLGEVMKTIIGSVAMITMALQFYNLKEKSDGQGTMGLVNSIGTKEDDESLDYTY